MNGNGFKTLQGEVERQFQNCNLLKAEKYPEPHEVTWKALRDRFLEGINNPFSAPIKFSAPIGFLKFVPPPKAGELALFYAPEVISNFLGRGDWLFLARYWQAWQQSDCSIYWHCHRELVPLLKPNFPFLLLPGDELPKINRVKIPVLGLPYGRSLSAHSPYIKTVKPCPLPPINKPRVGVCWSSQDQARRVPLPLLKPVLQQLATRAELVNLTLEPSPAGVPMVSPQISDFSDTAAILSGCDYVICSDSAVMNLAGAMGIWGCVLLPRWHDARWGRGDRPSWITTWHPSLTLCRGDGSWQSAIATMRETLESSLMAGC